MFLAFPEKLKIIVDYKWSGRYYPLRYCRKRFFHGEIAQLVEQRTENPRVVGSIPTLATFSYMHYFYVLRSQKIGRLYKGHAADIGKRLQQHNSGKTRSTRNGIPWALIYSENFITHQEAIKREKYFKSFVGGRKLKDLLV